MKSCDQERSELVFRRKKIPVFFECQADILARQQDGTRHGTRFLIAQMHDCFFMFLCIANVGWHDACLIFWEPVSNNLFHNHTSLHRSWTLSRRVVLWLRPLCGPAASVSQIHRDVTLGHSNLASPHRLVGSVAAENKGPAVLGWHRRRSLLQGSHLRFQLSRLQRPSYSWRLSASFRLSDALPLEARPVS